ncbi:primase homolog protein-like isoform X1 [Hevea brasiliensis]|uniref:primase homolog protein-like isoform X1 n=1 Tax=Hevea brasiliensis TaxID=3981 RepID=UPI0025DB08E4|nr:primase homolog protein-like isoform X1 [Hevea brasiliensis]
MDTVTPGKLNHFLCPMICVRKVQNKVIVAISDALSNRSCNRPIPSKHFLSNKNCWAPILTRRRLEPIGSRFLSCYRNSRLLILQSVWLIFEANRTGLEKHKVRILKQKMELLGINCHDSCIPGNYSNLFCPKCKGGRSIERSLSVHIVEDADFAMWRCYRTCCGWAGQAFADGRVTNEGMNIIFKVSSPRQITAEGIILEPIGEKLIAYFGDRMISEETLRRNSVMQMAGNQGIIAFTYRRNGVLIGCKYRTMEKNFWQDKGTEKWLYGLDDINEATEIVILLFNALVLLKVEGEIDKLSVEEAGFRNCVSVPGGAPQIVSTKDLPSWEMDKAYQYLWNCKEYLDKVSRIILATDGDVCGQALAEELARRLGKERCWLVQWPKKDHSSCFKDANEVLKCLGPNALREVIETAELYQVCTINQLI